MVDSISEAPQPHPQYTKAFEYFSGNEFRSIANLKETNLSLALQPAKENFELLLQGVKETSYPEKAVYAREIAYLLKDTKDLDNLSDFSQFAYERTIENITNFTQLVGLEDLNTDFDFGNLFLDVNDKFSDDPDRKKYISQMVQSLESKRGYLTSRFTNTPGAYASYLQIFIENSNIPSDDAKEAYLNLINKAYDSGMFYTLSLFYRGSISQEAGRHIVSKYLKTKYNLPSTEIFDTWLQSSYGDVKGEFEYSITTLAQIKNNLLSIRLLEEDRPGITNWLNKEYGINHFGRYPTETLISQYDSREPSPARPYFVVAYAIDDYNGAFYESTAVTWPESTYIYHFYRQAKNNGRELKIMEVASPKELIARLNQTVRQHGKIQGGIIGGHGEWDQIQFGKSNDLNSYANLTQLIFEGGDKQLKSGIEKFCVDNATFVLDSCSTGAPRGIAEYASEKGVRVIAPRAPTGIAKVNIFGINNNLYLTADYDDKNIGVVYVSGKPENM